jgi:hypothetical protein
MIRVNLLASGPGAAQPRVLVKAEQKPAMIGLAMLLVTGLGVGGWWYYISSQTASTETAIMTAESRIEQLKDAMKLLEKAPEHRYQSARGLLADFERLAAALHRGERAPNFPLAEHDYASTLQLPHQLYGRERERETLVEELATVIEQREPRLVLIGGPAGSGKSSLIRDLEAQLCAHAGYVGIGKFEQHAGEDALLVRAPLGELRQVVEDVGRVGVEDVRAVRMNQHARVVVPVVGVAADVRPLVHQQHALAQDGSQPLGQHAAGEPGADDEVVESPLARNRGRHRVLEAFTAFVQLIPPDPLQRPLRRSR